MIVTIIALAITILNCFVYFAPFLDYLSSRYWSDSRISPKIANEDLKKSLPDMADLAVSIQNTLSVLIVVLRLCQVSIEYLSGAIGIFAIISVMFFIGVIVKPYGRFKQILSVIFGIILVAVFCLAI